MGVGVLDRESIMALVQGPEPLIEGIVDLESQLQPNGFDLTLKEVSTFVSPGVMPNGAQRSSLSETTPLGFDGDGYATPGVRPLPDCTKRGRASTPGSDGFRQTTFQPPA